MPGFLDTLPLDFSLEPTQELQDLLARSYYSQTLIVQLLNKTPLSPGDVDLNGAARQVWFSILRQARFQDVLNQLIDAIRDDSAALRGRIDELLGDVPLVEASGAAGGDGDDLGQDGDDVAGIERQLAAASTLVDASFLQKGIDAASAVARLSVSMASGRYHGTAFRIGDRLLLTNHHVLFDWTSNDERARAVDIWFDYERDASGNNKPVHVVTGKLDSIVGDKEHDWALLESQEPLPDAYATLSLGPRVPLEEGERAYIVQHPAGGLKQIGLNRNLISHVDDNVIQYWTDTSKGSSGAPVLNQDWEVAGLHHRWVALTEIEQGIEITVYRNQGRRIERVIEGIEQAGIELPERA